MAVNASSARNSAVTSTTVEAVASGHDTPCSVTARAPNTKPPTCEKGRQLVDGVAHHAAPDEHPGAAGLAGRRRSRPRPAPAPRTAPAASRRSGRNPPTPRAARRQSRGRSRTSRSAQFRATGPPGRARSRVSSMGKAFQLPVGRRLRGGRPALHQVRRSRLYTAVYARGFQADGNGRANAADRCNRLRRLRRGAGACGTRASAAPAGPPHQRPAQPGRARRRTGAGRSHR